MNRIYPDYEDGSCDYINTSEPVPRPPSARPLCRIPCAQRDFDTILHRETVATAAVKDHRARVVKAKKLDAIPLEMLLSRSTAGAQDAGVGASRTPVKLPPIYLHIDDVGKITRRKVPFVRPHVWDTWDQNAPAHGYESLSNITRNSIFPGWTYNYKRRGETHDIFTDVPFRRRHQMPDQYRKKKDGMTLWAELDVKGKALLRVWNEAFGAGGYKQKKKD